MMKIKNILVSFLVITSMLMSNVYAVENVADIYVSSNGSDSGNGSINAPFKTLQAANDKVAEIKGSYSGVNVNIMAGTYDVSDLKFGTANSGSSEAKIVWKAYNGGKVILTSEKKIDNSRITAVNEDTIKKIPIQAQNNVKQIKLTDEEIKAIGPIRYTGQRASGENAPAYLAQDGKMFEIAGYPNKVNLYIPKDNIELTMTGYIYTIDDERVNRWSEVKDAYLTGNPTYEWYEDTLRIADVTDSKITTTEGGSYHKKWGGANLRIVNLVEEIDYPGEFYIDREEGYLYFYPLNGTTDSSFSLVTSQKPFMTIDGAQYISFENLIFDGTCSTGVIINNSNNITLKNCELKNIGKNAIDIIDSKYTTITGSHIHDIGKTAISISKDIIIGYEADGTTPIIDEENKEDFRNLTPCYNEISNCHIEKYGKVTSRNTNAVRAYGLGDTISHNRIHAADHSAIMFSGNNNIIEYNDIYDVLNAADDAGAIYAGRSWVDGGTKIMYNYIHDNPYSYDPETNGPTSGRSGVYLDDSFADAEIYGNVFANMNAGVKLHGSNYNDIQNNVFVNLQSSVHMYNLNSEPDTTIDNLNIKINNMLLQGEDFFKSAQGYKTLNAESDKDANILYQRYFTKYDPFDETGKYKTWNEKFEYLENFVNKSGSHMTPKGNVIKYNATYTGGKAQKNSKPISLDTAGIDNINSFNFKDVESKLVDVNNLDYTGPKALSGDNFKPLDITKVGIENEGSLTLNDFGVVYPQNKAYVDPGSAVLIWNEDSGADKYKLVVSENADLSDPVVDNVYVEDNFYNFEDITDGSTYYWTVEAITSHRLYSEKTKRIKEGIMSFTSSKFEGVVTLSNIVYRNGNGNKINAIENSSVNVVEFDLTNNYPNDINATATLSSFSGNGTPIGKATVVKDVQSNETIRAGVGISTSADSGAYMILTINSENGCELQYRIDSATMAGQTQGDKLAITSVTIKSEAGATLDAIAKGSKNVLESIVKSISDGEMNVRCIMATYDSEHKLVDSNATDTQTLKKGEEYTFETRADVSSDPNAYVKLFFWNDKMQPLVTDYDVQ